MKLSSILPLIIIFIMILTACEDCEFDSISTKELPLAHIQREYTATISTKQTCSPFAKYYTITKGSLPDGLKINDDGEITGIPIKQGVWDFTVMIEICFGAQNGFDADCHTKTAEFSIEVTPY